MLSFFRRYGEFDWESDYEATPEKTQGPRPQHRPRLGPIPAAPPVPGPMSPLLPLSPQPLNSSSITFPAPSPQPLSASPISPLRAPSPRPPSITQTFFKPIYRLGRSGRDQIPCTGKLCYCFIILSVFKMLV